jgi:hypothetical protein
MLDQNPDLTVEEMRIILRETAEDQVGDLLENTVGWDRYYGAGRVNAFKALQKVLNVNSFHLDEISLYPNPTDGKIYVSTILNNNLYLIYNSLGKEVSKGKIKGASLNLSNLKAGIYNLKIINNNNFISKKIVKLF